MEQGGKALMFLIDPNNKSASNLKKYQRLLMSFRDIV